MKRRERERRNRKMVAVESFQITMLKTVVLFYFILIGKVKMETVCCQNEKMMDETRNELVQILFLPVTS